MYDKLDKFHDPRQASKITYPLSDLLLISLFAICQGAETWRQIVIWAETHQYWLRDYIDTSLGVPSYSTIRRIFTLIKPEQFQCLLDEILDFHGFNKQTEDHIAVDGKTLRGSRCTSKNIPAMQMVSAFSVENQVTLAQVKTNGKSNEIKAIPLLLDLLNIEDTTISIDAAGCQKSIMSMIVNKKSHYVLGLKMNQPKLFQSVSSYFHEELNQLNHKVQDEFDDGHGRLVRRRYFVFSLPEHLKDPSFPEMKTAIAVERISRQHNQNAEDVVTNWHYYVTNHEDNNSKLPSYIRKHWQIESYHWLLDVHLSDDKDKKYEENSAENFNRVRRFILNLVKSKTWTGKKESIKSKLKRIGWDLNLLPELLFG